MTDPSNRTIYLLSQYAENLCTEAEADELFDIIKAAHEDETLHSFLQEQWTKLQPGVAQQPDWSRIYRSIILPKEESKVVRMRPWIKWVAAACIIALVGVLANVWVKNNRHTTPPAVATTHDIPAPTNTRAVITLADGSKVYLDSAGNGTIAQESNVAVVKNEKGEISYRLQGAGYKEGETAYNTLSNPRGSRVIDMTLSDGSHVWLNAGSSITYPVAFIGNDRIVTMTGEAYFEVKHNAKQPFKVHLPNGSVVEDIGTSFNVNAYTDEEGIKTTLIEGKVRLTPAGAKAGKVSPTGGSRREGAQLVEGAVTLRPGQQALLNQANPLIKRIEVQTADVDEVMAWKNGRFSFNRADIKTVMRQLARWYDLEVVYEGPQTTDVFGGDIQRDLPLSKTLDFLKKSQVSFELQGKKLIVRK